MFVRVVWIVKKFVSAGWCSNASECKVVLTV